VSFSTVKAWEKPSSVWWPRVLWVSYDQHFYNEVNCATRGDA